MTHRERMLATLRGEPTDCIPWAPRLDLWYNAHRRAGTLPAEYANAALCEITDDLGFGFHAIVPAFKDLRSPDDDIHRALGIYNLWTMPCRTRFENVDVRVTRSGDETHTEYRTPAGNLSTTVLYNDAMRDAGISITHVTEYPVKDSRDYAAMEYLFRNAYVDLNEEGYGEYAERVGDRGIAAGFLCSAAGPMHLLQRELMPMELFYYETYDHADELAACAEGIGVYFDRMFDAVARSSADALLLGANYDAGVTYPPFFREHIGPWLKRFARLLHAQGKFLITHTDGETTGLLDCYLESEIDVADSICPAPMTKLTFKEVRDRFAGRISIMGGVPSVSLLRNSMSDREFDAFLDRFFEELDGGDHLILGISDTTPPAADFGRIRRIGDRVRAFGPPRIHRGAAP